MLMTMKDLLSVAQQHKFGVGAFNIASAEFARVVIDVAEKMRSPVILEVHPDEHDFTGDDFIYRLSFTLIMGRPLNRLCERYAPATRR